MWTGKVTTLVLARQLVLLARSELGERKILLLCGSWYTKGQVAQLAGLPNLTIISNVQHDSAMYDPPQRPEKPPTQPSSSLRCTRWTTETSCPEPKAFRNFL